MKITSVKGRPMLHMGFQKIPKPKTSRMAPKRMATPQRTHPATAISFFDDTISAKTLKSNPKTANGMLR